MKKVYLSLALMGAFCAANAQDWTTVYLGDEVPSDLDENAWEIKDQRPNVNFAAESMELDGETVFYYYCPGVAPEVVEEEKYATKAATNWRWSTIGVSDATFVWRFKGFDKTRIESDSIDSGIQFDMRCEQSKWRDKVQFKYYKTDDEGNKTYAPHVRFESIKDADGNSLSADIDFDGNWHTYRFYINSADDKAYLYVDEAATPLLSAPAVKANDKPYDAVRWGDDSSDMQGGYIDWICLSLDGSFAPGQGPAIPEGLTVDAPVTAVNDLELSVINGAFIAPAGTEVYNLLGSLVASTEVEAEITLSSGVYFVKVGTSVAKIAIK